MFNKSNLSHKKSISSLSVKSSNQLLPHNTKINKSRIKQIFIVKDKKNQQSTEKRNKNAPQTNPHHKILNLNLFLKQHK